MLKKKEIPVKCYLEAHKMIERISFYHNFKKMKFKALIKLCKVFYNPHGLKGTMKRVGEEVQGRKISETVPYNTKKEKFPLFLIL